MQAQAFVRCRLLPSPSPPHPFSNSSPTLGSLSHLPIHPYLPQEPPFYAAPYDPSSPTLVPYPNPRKPPSPLVLHRSSAAPDRRRRRRRNGTKYVARAAASSLRERTPFYGSSSPEICVHVGMRTHTAHATHIPTQTHMSIQKVEMCQIETDIVPR